jgi:hypothetical protein
MEKNSLQKKHVKHNLNENISGEPVCVWERKRKDNDVLCQALCYFSFLF